LQKGREGEIYTSTHTDANDEDILNAVATYSIHSKSDLSISNKPHSSVERKEFLYKDSLDMENYQRGYT